MLNLLPGDRKYSGYLISYGNQPELIADTSSDSEKMVAKMSKLKPAGGSALYDAIYMACTSRKTIQGEPYEPRRIVMVIGDGHDTFQQEDAAGGRRDRAAQPRDHLCHEHGGFRQPCRR